MTRLSDFRFTLIAAVTVVSPLAAQGPTASGSSRSAAPQTIPAGVVEEPLTLGEGTWAVGGLLDRPTAAGRVPAVVLMHGSGPGTRDLDVGSAKVFREIGWGLASRGIIVARYDKRTTAHAAELRSTGRTLSIDEEFTDDAVAAVRLLLARVHRWLSEREERT